MASLNVSLPDSIRDWVRSRVESGEFSSESEYLHELIQRDRILSDQKLSVDDIRHSIEASRAEGRVVPADEVFERLEAKLKGSAT